MLEKLSDKLENLFVVDQKKQTGKGIFSTFLIALAIFLIIPGYVRYSKYVYKGYKERYDAVKSSVTAYYETHGVYPIGDAINWGKEKDLSRFMETNRMGKDRRLYYINPSLLPDLGKLKETYLIDIDYGMLYTSEYRIYQFTRWHYAVDI